MGFKLIDMAETPEESQSGPVVLSGVGPMAMPVKDNRPRYPYGLEITLNEDSLEKLGMKDNPPQVGEVLHAMVLMKVTSYSEHENENNSDCCVRAQIVQMGVENESKEYSYKEKMYDYGEEAEEDE